MPLFTQPIHSSEDWAKVYHHAEYWQPLVQAIYQRARLAEQVGLEDIRMLTPGTNAVFRVGNTVVKIMAPEESGMQDAIFGSQELMAHIEAESLGVPVPAIMASGFIHDSYDFEYLVCAHIEGRELGSLWPTWTEDRRTLALTQLKGIVRSLQQGEQYSSGLEPLIERALTNVRWLQFCPKVRSEVFRRVRGARAQVLLRVHGDITGENVLYCSDDVLSNGDASGSLCLLDFGDSCIAPPEYEYAALVFELFDMDPKLIRTFFRFPNSACFLRVLLPAVLLHDFGADYLAKAVRRFLHKSPEEVESLPEIEAMLLQYIY